VTAKVFRDFLRRLIVGMTQKIFLIVDGHPTHKAKLDKLFVEENRDRMELFFLPPYSPELNPDELAWARLKGRLGRMASNTLEELKKNAFGILKELQAMAHLVRAFFEAPTFSYAS
jgi:transposase